MTIRQPIVTVAGHVDHGKTTLLDSIRKTAVTEGEAGGITQKISFTKVPIENIKKRCPEISQYKLDFSGFLFIDTPGHAAFSNLRKRGGSLADLAVLVIDINEGIMPQTSEVLEILKINKTPFIIALNKIDNVSGWRSYSREDTSKKPLGVVESIQLQSTNAKSDFDEKLYTIIGSLHHHGFNAKPFYETTDFTTQLALVPCSGKTGEGINELIMVLCGLSQKFLMQRLELGKDAKGIILEIKKEKTMQYAEAILYDGSLSAKDEIAIASFNEPIITKIRVLEEILPISTKFKPVFQTVAANGIRMQLINSEEILPGMPFTIFKNNLEEIKKEFKKETSKIQTDEQGIIIKADSLGSLEALMILLKQENISILSAGIGKINKKDILSAQANLNSNPRNAVILGFNTEIDEEIKELDVSKIKIIVDEVIYKLIENLLKYQKEKDDEIKRQKLLELASICKLKILPQYIFRNSHPAIFGVEVEAGKLKSNIALIDKEGNEIGKVKDVQENQNKINEAKRGMQVAISLPGVTFDRQLVEIKELYSDINEYQFRNFKENKDILTQDEIKALQEIAQIKRKEKPTWGV
ncbi:MAG: translation initiation factor IF-2 [Nanoarchaeota archaeon]|nr:translation initiation factor IF-2 [Nanoarchaeota archaeon]